MSSSSCPGHEELAAFAAGKLPTASLEAIADHVDACPSCLATLQNLGAGGDTLQEELRRTPAANPFLAEPECHRVAAIPTSKPRPKALGQIGSYQLLEKLGEGGMGAVYKARHTHLKRIVAVKVLTADRLHDAAAVARFHREMEAVGKLQHPNIVQASDAGAVDGTHFLVMELVPGLDLSRLVKSRGPLALADACEIIRQAAVGLQHAHEHGLVHRDIKPSNLLLTPEGAVKVLDLGLALLESDQPVSEELTSTGQIMGTLDYMAPEQASDTHGVDIRADVYSLGCTLYYLLSGKAPFSGPQYRTALQKMQAHAHENVPPLYRERSQVLAGLDKVLGRLLAKLPANRYPDPAAVARALEPLSAGCDLRKTLLASETVAPENVEVFETRASLSAQATTKPPGVPASRGTWGKDPPLGARTIVALVLAGLLSFILAPLLVHGPINHEELPTKSSAPQEPLLATVDPAKFGAWDPEPDAGTAAGITPANLPGVNRWQADTLAPRGEIQALAWSPDSGFFACSSADPSGSVVRVYNAKTGGLVQLLPAREGLIKRLSWSADGRLLLIASHQEQGKEARERPAFCVWDMAAKKPQCIIPRKYLNPLGGMSSLAWSSDGKRFASAHYYKGFVAIWNAETGTRETVFEEHMGPCLAVDWSKDGRWLASGSSDGTVRLWDMTVTKPGPVLNDLGFVDGQCQPLCWSPDGPQLAYYAKNKLVKIWDAAVDKELKALPVEGRTLYRLTWRARAPHLAGIGWDRKLWLWDLVSGNLVPQPQDITLNEKTNTPSAWSPDGNWLALVDTHDVQAVQLWHVTRGHKGLRIPAVNADWIRPAAMDFVYVIETSDGLLQLNTPAELRERARSIDTPFVILGGAGRKERSFADLAQAVASANSGDVIEIRGDGPFACAPVTIKDKALVVRAAKGFRPVLRTRLKAGQDQEHWLLTNAPLVLEGLEFHQVDGPTRLITSRVGPLSLCHCRFFLKEATAGQNLIAITSEGSTALRQCELLGSINCAVDWYCGPKSTLLLDNCLICWAMAGIAIHPRGNPRDVSLQLTHNTFDANMSLSLADDDVRSKPNQNELSVPIDVQATDNILGPWHLFRIYRQSKEPVSNSALAKSWLSWREARNLYANNLSFLTIDEEPMTFAAWRQIWQQKDTGSLQGIVQYEGGNLGEKMATNPVRVPADHFRMKAKSPGKGAGADGMDLGCDVQLLGPGLPYEHWQSTPAYQQWLKDTGQTAAADAGFKKGGFNEPG